MHWPGDPTSGLRAVRYAESITIHVELLPDQSEGRIYSPYLSVKYAVATADDYKADKNVTVSLPLLLINEQIFVEFYWNNTELDGHIMKIHLSTVYTRI